MNIKTKLYITSVVLALVTVALTMAFNNILPQLAPWAVLYLIILYHLDRIKPMAFGELITVSWLLNTLFSFIVIAGVFVTQNVSFTFFTCYTVPMLSIVISFVLALTQTPFILKALRSNKK